MKNKIISAVMVIALMMICGQKANAAGNQNFNGKNVKVTSVLPPQYLGWTVALGSTTQTVPVYYKISALVPGDGETVASAVTEALSTYAPLSSTNSIRLMWASVDGALSYNLYKSLDDVSFYFLTNVTAPLLTFIDDGSISLATPYSAPVPFTGNLSVEQSVTVGQSITAGQNVTVGQVLYLGSASAIRGTITPAAAGGKIMDSVANVVCLSTAANKTAWVEEVSTTTNCPH